MQSDDLHRPWACISHNALKAHVLAQSKSVCSKRTQDVLLAIHASLLALTKQVIQAIPPRLRHVKAQADCI